MAKFCGLFLCLTMAALISGCGGGGKDGKDKRPATIAVSGVVTYKGEAVEGATVTFHPTQKGTGAFGVTDKAGKFELGSFTQKDGVVAGQYTVTVKKMEVINAGKQPEPGEPGYDPDAVQEPPKNLLPEKYADPVNSGLTATVGTTPITDLKFELQD